MITDVEGELVEDHNGEWAWRTADGRIVPVCLMQDTHLRNTSLFLMGMGYRKCIASQETRVVWLRILRIEWERRMIQRYEARKHRELDAAYDAQKELE